ncbi:MAG: hypothetical protein G01um101470_987, partial [Parcubacteria group bacterium Gr01-1014_70]
DDTTVPNISADVIAPFGSGLSNSGEILALKNADGIMIDRVDASVGWPAGDNISKDTMQKSTSGWITAPATPKAVNENNSSVIPGSTRDPEESETGHNMNSGSKAGMTRLAKKSNFMETRGASRTSF